MYCTNCGNQNQAGEKYCTNCGMQLNNQNNMAKNKAKTNDVEIIALTLGIISFIFMWLPLIAIPSAIISIVLGRKNKKETGKNSVGSILGIIGLIFSIIEIIVIIFLYVSIQGYINNLFQEIATTNNHYEEYYYEDNKTESFDIKGYSWLGTDNSILYLNNNKTYEWYQSDNDHNNNFHSGTYQYYTGINAINYISTNLKEYGLTEEEQRNIITRNNYDLENYYLIILNCNKSIMNNNEQNNINNKIYYYGFYNETYKQLDLINIATNTNAKFNLKNKISKIDI